MLTYMVGGIVKAGLVVGRSLGKVNNAKATRTMRDRKSIISGNNARGRMINRECKSRRQVRKQVIYEHTKKKNSIKQMRHPIIVLN